MSLVATRHFISSVRALALLLVLLLPGLGWAQAPAVSQAISLNTAANGESYSQSVTTDAAGNQYVTGYFTGTISLGATTLVSAGGKDVFVAKRRATDGSWLWAVRAGGTDDEVGLAVAADAAGNALVTGRFGSTATFGTSPTATTLTADYDDMFVAKFATADGTALWATSARSSSYGVGNSVTVDAAGNALVTGHFLATATFATSPTATTLRAAGSTDIFVAKFGAADGAVLWAIRAGGAYEDSSNDLAVDAAGNILLTGSFAGGASFATGSTPISLYSPISKNIFVAKLAADGKALWAVSVGGTFDHSGLAVAADAAGNALVTGFVRGRATFGTSPTATDLSGIGGNDIFVAKFAAANGVTLWVVRAGGTSADAGYGVAADADGNAVVTGYFQGTATFGTAPAAITLTSAASNDVFVAKFAAADGKALWAVRAGGAGSDLGWGVALDAAGQVLVSGEFEGTATFVAAADALAPGSGLFVARLDATTGAWQAPGLANNGGGNCASQSVAIDAAGNKYVVGYFTGSITVGGTLLVSAGSGDVFVAKFAADGTVLWAVRAGSTAYDRGYAVALDAAGNALVTGYFRGTATFGTGPAAISLTAVGSADVFVAKFAAADGKALWAASASGTNDEVGYGVAVDAAGNALVTGYFNSRATFATSPTPTTLAASSGTNLFVAKFGAADGKALWAVRAGSSGTVGTSVSYGVAVDAAGNALVTGYFSSTTTFATSPTATTLTASGNYDAFVAKFAAADGKPQWAVRIGGSGEDYGYAVAVDAAGNALVTGDFAGRVTFATSPTTISLNSAGISDVFVAKFAAANGKALWASSAGGTGNDVGTGVAVDAAGDVLVTGDFAGTATFGTSPTATSLTSAGLDDMFVAKFAAADGKPQWAMRAGGAGDDNSASVVVDAVGNVLVAGIYIDLATFGSLTLAGSGATGFVARLGNTPIVLPVTLTDFTARAEAAGVRLAWTTAQEQRSAYFEVERSFDGRTFTSTARVVAAGNSTVARAYQVVDEQLPATVQQAYYRLKQVDQDGTFAYSEVRTVRLSAATAPWLWPNPATARTTLSGAAPAAPVQVLDLRGRLVLVTTTDAAGRAELPLPAQLPAGVYLVRVGVHTVRLIKE